MSLDTTGTLLSIYDADTDATSLLPLYSARGLTQTLEHEDGALIQERTINGELIDLSIPRFRVLRSVISATDVRPPSRDVVWPGRTVIVECAYTLSYPAGGSPSRDVVPGSEFTEGDFTFYRPSITMMVGRMTGSFDEWAAGYSWSIELREILADA